MKRVALGLCIATAFAASVAAQAGTQTQPPTSTPQTQTAAPQTPSAAGAAGDITITGCLQKGADGMFTLSNVQQDATATGTSGTTAGAGATSPGATSTPGATATAGAAGGAAAAQTWNLRGGELAAHVGHRIAVTGKRAAAASSAGGASTSGAAATSGAAGAATTDANRPAASTSGSASSNMSNARTLEVSSVKMVSATCP